MRGESEQTVTEIAETRLGPIQYAISGVGLRVLVVHGTTGGYDHAAVMARFLPRMNSERSCRPGHAIPGHR